MGHWEPLDPQEGGEKEQEDSREEAALYWAQSHRT